MRIQLSEHFTYKKLLRFVAPSVVMMIFTSIYCVVDGFFVSNFAGEDGFAGVNLIYPIITCISAFGFMIGSGGSALVSKTFGEGKHELANRYFSMLIYATVIIGVLLSTIGIVFIDYIIIFLKASDNIIPHVKNYGVIMMIGLTAFMLQNVFQSFFVTAEKPKLGLYFMIGAGVTNMVLDALFVAVFNWGVKGAATATIISQAVGGFLPLIYFLSKNSSLLRLGKTAFYPKALLKTCTNGASELMINISMSVVNILYNF
jgi:Na+-driven multidrug efflux pump